MRKVIYGGGLFTYNDVKDLYAPERFVTLVEIAPPDEIESKKKFMAEAIKTGRVHPRKRPKAILKNA